MTAWGVPLVGFANADDELFIQLRTAVSPTHAVPQDLQPEARIVITFFLPFTDKGCCGRVGSLITSAVIEPDNRHETEACLYKYDGSCKKCTRKCVNEALFEDSFDRFKCYDMLLKNVEKRKDAGYADVCGKCLVAVPCSHSNPIAMKLRAKS